MKKRVRPAPTPEELGAELARGLGQEYQKVIQDFMAHEPMTFEELLAHIRLTVSDVSFFDFMYVPDADYGEKWKITIFFRDIDGAVSACGETKEDAAFLAFVSAISGGIRHYRN